jgi:predicted nucleic acid-binding protein
MAEVSRNLIEKFQLSEDKAAYRESEIRRHFPEAWVSGFEQLIPVMTNHEKDRHVLAAAVRAQAEIIVTYNRGDFPTASLAPYSISVQGTEHFPKESI